jgi:hypothetical protein
MHCSTVQSAENTTYEHGMVCVELGKGWSSSGAVEDVDRVKPTKSRACEFLPHIVHVRGVAVGCCDDEDIKCATVSALGISKA